MKNENELELKTRNTILKMLSNDEVGNVSTAETAVNLPKGDEYIDMEQLDRGVQKAGGTAPVMGHVLSRKSVHVATWTKILAEVAALNGATPPVGM
jgi:hypothetical protein